MVLSVDAGFSRHPFDLIYSTVFLVGWGIYIAKFEQLARLLLISKSMN